MLNLGILPTEILSSIIAHVDKKDLYACTLINKLFYTLTTPVLWRSPLVADDLSFTKVMAGIADSHPSLGQHIRKLFFGYEFFMTDAMLLLVMLQVPLLEDLDLCQAKNISDTSMTRLARHCPHLRSLHLENNSRITHLSLVALAQHGTPLRQLHLMYTTPGTPSPTLLSHLPHFPLLDELLVISGSVSSSRSYDTQVIKSTTRNIANLHALTTLMFETDSPIFTQRLFTTTTITTTAPWPHLTNLCLSSCQDITDQQAMGFFQTHPHLKTLAMTSTKFTDAVLDAMITYLPGLTWIGLEKNTTLTPIGWRRLIQHCPHLEFADVHQCGLLKKDFPEVQDDDDHCLDPIPFPPGALRHLDDKAIKNIRRDPALTTSTRLLLLPTTTANERKSWWWW